MAVGQTSLVVARIPGALPLAMMNMAFGQEYRIRGLVIIIQRQLHSGSMGSIPQVANPQLSTLHARRP